MCRKQDEDSATPLEIMKGSWDQAVCSGIKKARGKGKEKPMTQKQKENIGEHSLD